MPTALDACLLNLPKSPGIYQMIDAQGQVLYVGKAANLKARVKSYFSQKTTSQKTKSLVSQIAHIEISVTRSETEALLLESNLIKSLRPKYNVLMRDDKSYPYIHLSRTLPFPRLYMVRFKSKPPKGDYFGPYPSVAAVKSTLDIIQKVFKIRSCTDTYFKNRVRPCLQFQIHRCSGPCVQLISRFDYEQSVRDTVRFLEGKCQLIIDDLMKRMEQATHLLDYENAARLRDQIKKLRLVQEKQSMVQEKGDVDIVAIEATMDFACVQCVRVRKGQLLANEHFNPAMPKAYLSSEEHFEQELWQQVFQAFISFHYLDNPERIPKVLITNHEVADQTNIEALLSTLRGHQCQIKANPKRGVALQWLQFANTNLEKSVQLHQISKKLLSTRFKALEDFLGMNHPITRMECFDISHTSGKNTVASCVVFNQEGPLKREYRHFNITDIKASDDYAAMEQVLSRRLSKLKADNELPDLIIVDGGKGQVNIAKKVLNKLSLNHITLLGIAKGVHRKAGMEQLILAFEEQERILPPQSPALHLLQHIRDEAHRFAVKFHQKKRQKSGLTSSLQEIPGIGAKRRQGLLRYFGGMRELMKAPTDEIAKVSGISMALARKIYSHFHGE